MLVCLFVSNNRETAVPIGHKFVVGPHMMHAQNLKKKKISIKFRFLCNLGFARKKIL